MPRADALLGEGARLAGWGLRNFPLSRTQRCGRWVVPNEAEDRRGRQAGRVPHQDRGAPLCHGPAETSMVGQWPCHWDRLAAGVKGAWAVSALLVPVPCVSRFVLRDCCICS